jgi:hypothetical protein
MRFHATVQLHGKTATGIEVPAGIVAALGRGTRPKVTVTLNGYSYPSSVGSMGGLSLIPVSAEVRNRAGVAAGDEVDVDIVPDTGPRVVEVPDDLAHALSREPAARRAFDHLSYSGQRRYVLLVEQAKTAETRQRRIGKVVTELGATTDSEADGVEHPASASHAPDVRHSQPAVLVSSPDGLDTVTRARLGDG